MEVVQDPQAKCNDAEVDLPSQWVAMGLQKSRCSSSNKTAEKSATLRIAQLDGTKVAFKELQNKRMGSKQVLGLLLLLQHQLLVCWQKLNLRVQGIDIAARR